MSQVAAKRITLDDYLEFERRSEVKHEFFDGEIFAMVGGTAAHSLIAGNLTAELRNRLATGPCRVFNSDMRVMTGTGLYTYPDISVVCQQPMFADERTRDALLNPQVICEVLSPSTEAYDRGKKFQHYRSIVTLQEYILISADRHVIEHYLRQSDPAHWLLTAIVSLDGQLHLPSLGIQVPLREVYAKVDEVVSPEIA